MHDENTIDRLVQKCTCMSLSAGLVYTDYVRILRSIYAGHFFYENTTVRELRDDNLLTTDGQVTTLGKAVIVRAEEVMRFCSVELG